jgi:nitrogen fixation protein NifZ
MIDLREPKFQWGQPVVAAVDLYNDGSLPDAPEDVLLVAAGGPGEIVQVGHHSDANVPIYMVDFGVAVLGCLEEELAPETATAAVPTSATAPVAEALT